MKIMQINNKNEEIYINHKYCLITNKNIIIKSEFNKKSIDNIYK